MIGWAFRCLVFSAVCGVAVAAWIDRDWQDLAAHAIRDSYININQNVKTLELKNEQNQYEHRGGLLEEVVRSGPNGHFVVDAFVNGVKLDFLLDTGASHLVLNAQDAAKLGFSKAALRFDRPFGSANGIVHAAPVTLRHFRVGQLQLFDLDAYVNEGPMDISLLGMSFLRHLQGYEVAGDRLIMRW